jgi:hypothetical protein
MKKQNNKIKDSETCRVRYNTYNTKEEKVVKDMRVKA